MTTTAPIEVRRRDAAPDPLLDGARWDYADAFEATLSSPDDHTPADWMRAAIGSGNPAAGLVPAVHRHVLRFRLDATEAAGLSGLRGWRVLTATDDVIQLEADGSLMRANLIARRLSPTRTRLSTYLFYRQPAAAAFVWLFIRPMHQAVAAGLMRRAASRIADSVA